MPAYPTHTLFSHMAILALLEAGHPLAPLAFRHQGLFRIAGIAGADIQCMPYQVCQNCQAPYRHDQRENRKCLVCGEEALEAFTFAVSDGRRLNRVDVERNYYRHTHLVLGRRPLPYGVDPNIPPGPAEQPFPEQVIRHLANLWRDAGKIAGPAGRVTQYLAFTLGWFSHVVSDAIFKGVYPHSVRVNFFGHQYHMAMLPAAETLTRTDISHDFGVHWPTWHEELLNDEPDGGALRHLTMGNPAELYDRSYWTAEFGKPDPAIGRIMEAVAPINRAWFYKMYLTPDYTDPTPPLDRRNPAERASWKFNGLDLGQLREYAIRSGWYHTFIKGIDIYLRAVDEAGRLVDLDRMKIPSVPAPGAGTPGGTGWRLWREIVRGTIQSPPNDRTWGGKLEIEPGAAAVLRKPRRRPVKLILPRRPTDYQEKIREIVLAKPGVQPAEEGGVTLMIGPPAFNDQASAHLSHEDVLRAKYRAGLAGMIFFDPETAVLHLAGLSDFGDQQIIQWLGST